MAAIVEINQLSPFPFLQPDKQCEINMLYTPRFIVCIYFNGGIWLFCSLRFTPPRLPSSSTLFSLIHFIDCMRFFVMLQTSAKQLTNSNMPQESVSLFPLAFSRSPLSLTHVLACFSPCFISFFHCCAAANAIDKRARGKNPCLLLCAVNELSCKLP